MSADSHLIKMMCDIARFFAPERDDAEAVNGIVNHIEKFWNPRMRHKLIASSPVVKDDVPLEQLAKRPES